MLQIFHDGTRGTKWRYERRQMVEATRNAEERQNILMFDAIPDRSLSQDVLIHSRKVKKQHVEDLGPLTWYPIVSVD